MNNVSLVGRLTKDVELKYSGSGVAVASFTVAVNRAFKKDETDFINCKAFNKQAENLANFMKKGSQIGLVGRIQTGSYENNEGKRIYTTDVIADNIEFLEPKKQENSYQQQKQQAPSFEIDTEELPF